ncbi:MAG: hypothetical protein CMN30_11780 [Sandaracinus sp.]|nr:hypothetical protein [Sandaracinus sp.]
MIGFLLLAGAASAHAQVNGLEMSIDGATEVRTGEAQLAVLTLHEVRGTDALRPAAGARLTVTASWRADGPLAQLRTDAHGRAPLAFTIPEDGAEEIVVDAFLGSRSRRFRFPVHATRRSLLSLTLLPERAVPGGEVLAFGHATDDLGRPLAERSIRVAIPGGATATATTDAVGAFVVALPAPRASGTTEVRATLDSTDDPRTPGAGAGASLVVAEAEEPQGLRARALPREPVVSPGATVAIDVEVRDGLGRPVPAQVRRDGDPDPVRAGADGVARFNWHAPSVSGVVDQRLAFLVELPGELPIRTHATVRVAAVPAAVDIAPEGGALIPGVPTRLFVHAVRADGGPYRGPLRLAAPRLGDHTLTTDAEGRGAVEVILAETGAPDACGGATAVAVQPRFEGRDGAARCLPVDPDAAVRVRAERREGRLHVEVHRRPAVARDPASVTVFVEREHQRLPVATEVLPARADAADLAIPESLAQVPLLVRARALHGSDDAAVRGSFARVDGRRAPRVSVVQGHASGEGTVASVRVPLAVAEALRTRFAPADALARARDLPRDTGAPHLLVGGDIRPAPPVDDAVSLGILRDPWRQRALFRTGRLALIFRALESRLAAAASADDLETLAYARNGRRRFKEDLLATLDTGEVGPEGARDLGGEALTLARLRSMDRAFSLDAVARRVTRKALVDLLVQWRPWVRERDLDPAFAPHADPRHWYAAFAEENGWARDGWGRPFGLTPAARDSRAPVVVPGWVLTSAGPDGRLGTGDDLTEPFASMLPPGVYADAVGEAEVVQALSRGVLDRETLRLLDIEGSSSGRTEPVALALPGPLSTEPAPFLAPSTRFDVAVGDARHQAPLPPALVPHAVVALGFGGPAGVRVAVAPVEGAGGARLATTEIQRLHPDAPLTIPLVVVGAERTEGLRLEVQAEGLEARLDDPTVGTLAVGAVAERSLTLTAAEVGRARVRVRLHREDRLLAERVLEPRVVDGTPQRTLWAGQVARGEWDVAFPLPEAAREPHVELIVTAPGRVDRDPRFAFDAIDRAWAQLMAGRGEAVHLDTLPAPTDGVEAAQLTLLWAALSDTPRHPTAEARLRSADATEAPRLLTVLSAMALPRWSESPRVGAAAEAHRLRERLWGVHSTEPAELARIAAALLVTDPADEHGRAAYVRARREWVDAGDGARALPAERPADRLAGTLALALAAHALGEEATRDALLGSVGPRVHLAASAETDADFWLLAASALGAFGRDEGEATLVVDGDERSLVFEDGLARVTLDGSAGVAFRLVTGAPHLARVEARYGRPVEARDDAPLRVELEGIVGAAGRRAGYEVRVDGIAAVGSPVLAITLPPGAHLEESALRAIRGSSAVRAVDGTDARGVLRVRLAAVAAEASVRFPLPLRWTGAGAWTGLAMAIWERDRPWAVTSVPARTIEVR